MLSFHHMGAEYDCSRVGLQRTQEEEKQGVQTLIAGDQLPNQIPIYGLYTFGLSAVFFLNTQLLCILVSLMVHSVCFSVFHMREAIQSPKSTCNGKKF